MTGLLEVRITTAKGQARAGTVCALYLSNALVSSEPRLGKNDKPRAGWGKHNLDRGRHRHCNFADVAAVSSRGTPSPGATATAGVNAPRIGTPTIIIGKP